MTYNTENTLMETKNFTLPEMVESDFSNEDLADDFAGLQLSFQHYGKCIHKCIHQFADLLI